IISITPTVPCMVSSRVRPVNTRMVVNCSSGDSVDQVGTSLDSGTFSGTQKLLTTRCQTSRSVWSSTAFQLIAFFGSIRGLSAVIAVSLRGGVGSARHNTPKGRDGYLRPGV